MALPERKLRTLHLFAGAGGGILADILLGHLPVCAVEIDSYCRSVLLARQRDGHLPRFPVWDDVRTFDGRSWRGSVEIVAGGFPCQDISSAGKGAGIGGTRSGLWSEMARIIGEIRPAYAFVENSPMLTLRGLGRILGDLAEMGFSAQWGVISAADSGAPHRRERIWIYAHTNRLGPQTDADENELRHAATGLRPRGHLGSMGSSSVWPEPRPIGARPMGVGDGVAADLDRIKACGNGQVPLCAALAWRILRGVA